MRTRFLHENCSVARSLEVLGDWWTLLVIREAFAGSRRFADFEAALGISKNILTQRLRHLVKHRVLARVDVGEHGRRYEYVLTPKGKDLLTVVTALREWGDRWVFGPGKEPLLALDRRTGRPLPRVRVLDERGAPVARSDFLFVPGPGASKATRQRIEAAIAAARGESDA